MNNNMLSGKLETELRRSPRIAAMQARAGCRARADSAPVMPVRSTTLNTVTASREFLRKSAPIMGDSDDADCSNFVVSPEKERESLLKTSDGGFAKPKPRNRRTLMRTLRKRKTGLDETLRFSSMGTKRKRKLEEGDLDNISITSLNLSKRGRRSRRSRNDEFDGDGDNISIQSYTAGTSTRRSRTLMKVTSLANLVSPVTSVKRVGVALQRSISFRTNHSPPFNIKPYCKPAATPTKRRDSVLWSETVQSNINEGLTKRQRKRQEVIYELFRGELDMVDDLRLIMKTYRDSMRSLNMLSEQESETIFGRLEDLQPLHQDLINKLTKQRRPDGTTEIVGKVLLEWLPTLTNIYTAYCTNLLAAKVLLDEKRQDKKVQDFLERCLESPFSRRLDLWNFLDVPRRRLIKYRLLIQKILEVTPNDHADRTHLSKATKAAEHVSQEVDQQTGEIKCRHYVDHLVYLRDSQEHPLICQQKTLLCGGVLRSIKGRGTKLHVFLFKDILVVTRIATRNDKKMYQVYENPIPVQSMQLEDLEDGEVKLGGSFRNLTGSQTVNNAFRVKSSDPNLRQSFTFYATNEHDKKQWVQLFKSAIRTLKTD